MTTKEFLTILQNNPNQPLQFEYQQGSFVRMDYHITEIKNVNYDTVDCGGVRNQWQEVHIQLWENEMPEPHHQVTTTKALDIFEVVEKARATYGDVEMKFEYGNSRFHKSVLPISGITVHSNQVIVQLGQDQTCCKAKDRAETEEEKAVACCAPAAEVVEKPQLDLSTMFAKGDACTPGGGCC